MHNEGITMLSIKNTGLALSLIAISVPSFSEELSPIIVTATRSAQSLVTTPSSISIITSEDIEQSGATQLIEVLNSQASIQINDLYGTGSRASVSMRGFADNAKTNVQILVNGRRLNNPDLAAADLSGISLKDVKQIEIIHGSAGTLFGDQAVGGVINIITKTPEKSSSYVQVEAGSYKKRNLRASISDKKGNLSYRFSVEDLKSDNYREHNEQDYQNILGRIDYENKNVHVFSDYQVINEEIELPGSLSKAQMLADPRQVGSTPNDENVSTTEIIRLGIKTAVTSNWNFESEITYRDSEIKGKNFGSDFTQDRDHVALTPRFIGALPNSYGDSLITIGIDHNIYNYEIASPFVNTIAEEETSAIYAQFVIPVSEKITTTFGGRYAQVKDNITDPTAFPTGIELDDNVSVFEAGISFQLSSNSRLFARIDENFRFAKIDENTYTSPGIVGLKTQEGKSLEIGGEWKNSTSAFNVTAYSLELDNEIEFDSAAPSPGFFPGANANLDPTTRVGLTLEGKHKFTSAFDLNAQYSYIDGTFEGGTYDGKKIPFVATNNLTVNAHYKFSNNWSTYAEARYTSERYQASDYANTRDQLPSLTVLNIQVQHKVNNWLTSLRINNLGDKKYASYATFDGYYPAPERNLAVKVRYNF